MPLCFAKAIPLKHKEVYTVFITLWAVFILFGPCPKPYFVLDFCSFSFVYKEQRRAESQFLQTFWFTVNYWFEEKSCYHLDVSFASLVPAVGFVHTPAPPTLVWGARGSRARREGAELGVVVLGGDGEGGEPQRPVKTVLQEELAATVRRILAHQRLAWWRW